MAALLVAPALLLAAPAWCQEGKGPMGPDADLVLDGLKLAEENCGKCHALGKTGASPLADAPPFREFVIKWPLDSLEEALAEGIVTGHPDMPEFKFSPDEISALMAYLDGLGN